MPDMPPLVLDITGDAGDLISTLSEVASLLSAFADKEWNVNLGINEAALDSALADADAKIKAALSGDFPVDVSVGTGSLVAARAEIDAILGKTVTIPVNVSTASLLGGALASGLAADLGGAAGGGGGGGPGLLASLGFGSGAFGLFAGFGTIASLMGAGIEHLVTTIIGVMGSAVGGLLGGGLLAAGSLGVGAVGLGTDLAGIGQAAGDIKAVTTAMSALNTAIQTYGANSTQAATAQAQLNVAENAFNPIAKANVIAAAAQIQTFKQMFDQYTGQAESTGAAIINSLVQVGEKFLPTIGKFAAENMTIIQAALVPLENFLQGPGLTMFNHMEEVFQKNLPTAMQAFDQAIEVVLKTLNYLSNFTGGFLQTLDKFFTKLNTPAGFAAWENEINKLIGLFHTWDQFAKLLIEDIALIFSKSAGLGSGIIQELTGYLEQLHNALESSSSGLSSLFSSHRAEVEDLIALIIQIGTAFVDVYLLVAPLFTKIATFFIKLTLDVISLINHLPGGKDLVGFAILLSMMGVLGPLFIGVTAEAGLFATALSAIGETLGLQSALLWIKNLIGGIFGLEAVMVDESATAAATNAEIAATTAAMARSVTDSLAEVDLAFDATGLTAQENAAKIAASDALFGTEAIAPEVLAGAGAGGVLAGGAEVAGVGLAGGIAGTLLAVAPLVGLGIALAMSKVKPGSIGGGAMLGNAPDQYHTVVGEEGRFGPTYQPNQAGPTAAQQATANISLQTIASLTAVIAATKAEDATVKAQAADLSQLQKNIVTQTQLAGTGSKDSQAAIQALIAAEEKFAGVAAKDTTVKSQLSQVYAQIQGQTEHLQQLQNQQASLAKDGTLSQTKAELSGNLAALKADNAAHLSNTNTAVVAVKAQIKEEEGHIDQLKDVAKQIAQTKDILNVDNTLKTNLQNLINNQTNLSTTANAHLAALAGNTNGESTKLDAITSGVNLAKQATAAAAQLTAQASTNAGNALSGKLDAINASIGLTKTAVATATTAANQAATNSDNFVGLKLAAVTTGVGLAKASTDAVSTTLKGGVPITKLPGITTTVTGNIVMTVQ